MTLDDQERARQDLSEAARLMGREGGLAGKGRRTEAARKAARARWDRAAVADRLFTVDGEEPAINGRALLTANDNDLYLLDLLASLEIGQSKFYGGGAGAEFMITRLE